MIPSTCNASNPQTCALSITHIPTRIHPQNEFIIDNAAGTEPDWRTGGCGSEGEAIG